MNAAAVAAALRALADAIEAPGEVAPPAPPAKPRSRKRVQAVAPAPASGEPVDEVTRMRNRREAEAVLRRKGYPV